MHDALGIYDHAPTELFSEDRSSILALRGALRRAKGTYAYLEIGSAMGGSLQPFLADPACRRVVSIDPRPRSQPDERGTRFEYPENSTARMIDTLRSAYGQHLGKLETHDSDASAVGSTSAPADLCFIDGEHTDRAVASDFEACLRLGTPDVTVLFDDVHIVFRGFERCVARARAVRPDARAYVMPRKIGVIELGPHALWRDDAVGERLADAGAYLFATGSLAHYRDGILALRRLPGAELARRILGRLPGAAALRPRANPESGAYERPERSQR